MSVWLLARNVAVSDFTTKAGFEWELGLIKPHHNGQYSFPSQNVKVILSINL